MKTIGSFATVFALVLWSSISTTRTPVQDPRTQAYIGDRDDVANGDDRIITTLPESNVSFTKDGSFRVVLGVEEYGPIDVSVLLASYPEIIGGTRNASLCRVENSGEDPIVMNSTNSITKLDVKASHMIAQFGIVYLFSDTTNSVYGAKFDLAQDRKTFNFSLLWELKLAEITSGGFGSSNIISDTYNSQLVVFIGTYAFYINTRFTKTNPETKPAYISVADFSLSLYGTVRYMDAYFGSLVILTTDELALFNLTANGISGARFVIDGDFNIVEGVVDLRDFELNPDRTQTYNTINSFSASKIYPYQDYFYNFSMSLANQMTAISTQRITSNLLFVADSQKVHVFDFSLLKSGKPGGKLPIPLEVANVVSVRRYKESLYLLKSSTSDVTSDAVEVVEVFLLANSVTAWSDVGAKATDLYYVNNVFKTDFPITEIFVDDVYVYMQGKDRMAVAYRGKPMKYSNSQTTAFTGSPHEGIGDIGKVLVNGFGIYFGLLNKVPTAFNMSIREISINCPVDKSNQNFGDYIIQFNATTATCPKKRALLASTLDVRGTVSRSCVLQKNLHVNYVGNRPGKDSSIMMWFYGAIGIFALLVIGGIIYLVIRRRGLKVNPTKTMEVVPVTDNVAKGVFDVQHFRNPSEAAMNNPTERGSLKSSPETEIGSRPQSKNGSMLFQMKVQNKLE